MDGKISFNALLALRCLRVRGPWPGSWDIGNERTTERILRAMVTRGFVETFHEVDDTTRYRITDAGRDYFVNGEVRH